jgi:hypothetical protein
MLWLVVQKSGRQGSRGVQDEGGLHPANPPSPVPEEADEENESLDSDVDHEVDRPSTPNAVSTIVTA